MAQPEEKVLLRRHWSTYAEAVPPTRFECAERGAGALSAGGGMSGH